MYIYTLNSRVPGAGPILPGRASENRPQGWPRQGSPRAGFAILSTAYASTIYKQQ